MMILLFENTFLWEETYFILWFIVYINIYIHNIMHLTTHVGDKDITV